MSTFWNCWGKSASGTERRGRLRARVSFEEVVRAVEEARGTERTEWLAKHGEWGKWLVLRLARRYSGMTLAELGRQMGALTGRDMDYAAVSAGLRWFQVYYLRQGLPVLAVKVQVHQECRQTPLP